MITKRSDAHCPWPSSQPGSSLFRIRGAVFVSLAETRHDSPRLIEKKDGLSETAVHVVSQYLKPCTAVG